MISHRIQVDCKALDSTGAPKFLSDFGVLALPIPASNLLVGGPDRALSDRLT